MRWFSRIVYWFRFRRNQLDLREELSLHRDLLAAEFERRGLSAPDGRAAADRAMGNETLMREDARAVWLPIRLEALLQDARYAWRGLIRSPGFTLVAVASLALGIGANTAIFSLIDALLLARLPVPGASQLIEPERVVGAHGIDQRFSRAEFDALSAGPVRLSMFAWTGASLDIDGLESSVSVDAVDRRYFPLLRVQAQRGRLLDDSDDAAANPVAVITDRFWRGRLNADPAVLGRRIKINGQSFTIVGVTPRQFAGLRFPAITDATIPLRTAIALNIVRASDAGAPAIEIVGRRPDAWTLGTTERALDAAWKQCCARGDLVRQPRGQILAPATLSVADVSRGIPVLKMDLRGRYTRVLIALMGGVAVLLLAACVNVGSLLLARASARAHELAVRVALGASRGRVLVQLLVESLELSLLGSAGGILLAWWGTTLLARGDLGDLAGIASPVPDSTVLAFTGVVSLVSGIVFGVAPAWRIIRGDLAAPIQRSPRPSSRRATGALDRGLVAIQIALALLLVSGAALLTQTLHNLREADLGFDPDRRLVFSVDTRRTPYAQQGMTAELANEMLRAVRALPGVTAAGFASEVPIFGGRGSSDDVTLPGAPESSHGDASTDFVGVTPDFFAALGIPIRRGNDIAPPTSAGLGIPVDRDVVVNESFAHKFFPNMNALGRVFHDADEGDSAFTADRIVGIVSDTKFTNPRQAARPMYFVRVLDHDWPYLVLVVHTPQPVERIGASIARALAGIAPGISVDGPSLLAASVDQSLVRERLAATLGMIFGTIALCLVAVGLYGVLLYQVTQRTREIGIRMALGAQPSAVLAMVLRQSLSIVAVGLAAGLPLALLAGRGVSSQLYGVGPYDLRTLLAVAGTLMAVAVAASLVPARRAVGIDPLQSLRAD
jgi:predicted permease